MSISDTLLLRNKKKYNCPNCAAPITNYEKCEYCGTLIDWMPVSRCEIVYSHKKLVPLTVVVRTPSELPKFFVGKDYKQFIHEEISRNLVKEAAKYITILQNYDYVNDCNLYKGTLTVAEPNETENTEVYL